MAYKSDIPAKQAFIEKLLAEGYDTAEVKARPADIIATRGGVTWYYEIKLTDHEDKCFGAATLTEWEQAFKTPETYRFVIAIRKPDQSFEFRIFTPSEFMQFSTIPPFKVYFNIALDGRKPQKTGGKQSAISLTEANFQEMNTLFKRMKEERK